MDSEMNADFEAPLLEKRSKSGGTIPCKVTPVVLHGVVSPELRSSYTGLYPDEARFGC